MGKSSKQLKFIGLSEQQKLWITFIQESKNGLRLQRNGKRINHVSIKKYKQAFNLMYEFCETKKFNLKLYFTSNLIEKELQIVKKHWTLFYKKFINFMYEKGYFDNYVGTTIKVLRTFFNYLITELQLPIGLYFKKFYIPKDDIQIVVLSLKQLAYLIKNKELESTLPTKLKIAKDIFVFGCTVSLRFSDIMGLKPFNLVQQNGAYYLQVKSKKTSTDTSIKLPGYAIEIIEKYKNKQPTLLPKLNNTIFNKQLKLLANYFTNPEPMIKIRLKRGIQTVIYKNAKKKFILQWPTILQPIQCVEQPLQPC